MPSAYAEFAKNFAKSVGYSTLEVIGDQFPNTKEIIENAADVARDVRSSLMDFKSKGPRQAAALDASKTQREISKIIQGTLSDIKSGNFSVPKDIDINDIFGDDDEEEAGSVDAAVDDAPKKPKVSQEARASVHSAAFVADAIGKTSEANMLTQTRLTKALIKNQNNMSLLQMNHLGAGIKEANMRLKQINQNLATMIDFMTKNQGVVNQAHLKYMQQSESYMRAQMEILHPTKKGAAYNPLAMKGFDVKSYAEMVKKNLKESSGMGGLASLGGQLNVMQAMMGGMNVGSMVRPTQYLMKGLMSRVLPRNMQRAMKNFDKILPNAIMSGLSALGDYAGETGTLGSIADIFGVGGKKAKGLRLDKYNRDAVAWDGTSKKALEEVIPSLLSMIEVNTRSLKKVEDARYIFDYDTGTFIDANKAADRVKKKTGDIKHQAAYELRDRLEKNRSRLSDADIQKAEKLIDEYLDEATFEISRGTGENAVKRKLGQIQGALREDLIKLGVHTTEIRWFLTEFSAAVGQYRLLMNQRGMNPTSVERQLFSANGGADDMGAVSFNQSMFKASMNDISAYQKYIDQKQKEANERAEKSGQEIQDAAKKVFKKGKMKRGVQKLKLMATDGFAGSNDLTAGATEDIDAAASVLLDWLSGSNADAFQEIRTKAKEGMTAAGDHPLKAARAAAGAVAGGIKGQYQAHKGNAKYQLTVGDAKRVMLQNNLDLDAYAFTGAEGGSGNDEIFVEAVLTDTTKDGYPKSIKPGNIQLGQNFLKKGTITGTEENHVENVGSGLGGKRRNLGKIGFSQYGSYQDAKRHAAGQLTHSEAVSKARQLKADKKAKAEQARTAKEKARLTKEMDDLIKSMEKSRVDYGNSAVMMNLAEQRTPILDAADAIDPAFGDELRDKYYAYLKAARNAFARAHTKKGGETKSNNAAYSACISLLQVITAPGYAPQNNDPSVSMYWETRSKLDWEWRAKLDEEYSQAVKKAAQREEQRAVAERKAAAVADRVDENGVISVTEDAAAQIERSMSPEERKILTSRRLKNLKHTMGRGIKGAVLGAMFGPGGPMTGALLGAAAGMLSARIDFKKFLFGAKTVDEDGHVHFKDGIVTQWSNMTKTTLASTWQLGMEEFKTEMKTSFHMQFDPLIAGFRAMRTEENEKLHTVVIRTAETLQAAATVAINSFLHPIQTLNGLTARLVSTIGQGVINFGVGALKGVGKLGMAALAAPAQLALNVRRAKRKGGGLGTIVGNPFRHARKNLALSINNARNAPGMLIDSMKNTGGGSLRERFSAFRKNYSDATTLKYKEQLGNIPTGENSTLEDEVARDVLTRRLAREKTAEERANQRQDRQLEKTLNKFRGKDKFSVQNLSDREYEKRRAAIEKQMRKKDEIVYQTDENGEIVKDENGNPVPVMVKDEKTGEMVAKTKKVFQDDLYGKIKSKEDFEDWLINRDRFAAKVKEEEKNGAREKTQKNYQNNVVTTLLGLYKAVVHPGDTSPVDVVDNEKTGSSSIAGKLSSFLNKKNNADQNAKDDAEREANEAKGNLATEQRRMKEDAEAQLTRAQGKNKGKKSKGGSAITDEEMEKLRAENVADNDSLLNGGDGEGGGGILSTITGFLGNHAGGILGSIAGVGALGLLLGTEGGKEITSKIVDAVGPMLGKIGDTLVDVGGKALTNIGSFLGEKASQWGSNLVNNLNPFKKTEEKTATLSEQQLDNLDPSLKAGAVKNEDGSYTVGTNTTASTWLRDTAGKGLMYAAKHGLKATGKNFVSGAKLVGKFAKGSVKTVGAIASAPLKPVIKGVQGAANLTGKVMTAAKKTKPIEKVIQIISKVKDELAKMAKNTSLGKALAGTGADSPGLIKKITDFVDGLLKKVSGIGDKIDQFATKIDDLFAKFFANSTVGAVVKGALFVFSTAWSAFNGWQDTAKLFEVSEENVDGLMRTVSVIIRILLDNSAFIGAGLELIDVVIESIFGISVLKSLASLIYNFLFGLTGKAKKGEKTLKEKQDEFIEEYQQYLADNNLTEKELSFADYNNLKNATLLDKASNWVGSKLSSAGKAISGAASKVAAWWKGPEVKSTTATNTSVGAQAAQTAQSTLGSGKKLGAGLGSGKSMIKTGTADLGLGGMYSQNDPRYKNRKYASDGTVGSDGCGIVALANAREALGGAMDAVDQVGKATRGTLSKDGEITEKTMQRDVKKLGMTAQKLGNWKDITKSLDAGQPVVMAGMGSGLGGSVYGGTGNRHVITALGRNADGTINIHDGETMRTVSPEELTGTDHAYAMSSAGLGGREMTPDQMYEALINGVDPNQKTGTGQQSGPMQDNGTTIQHGAYYFSQKDPRWGSAGLRGFNTTIYKAGCNLTSHAMAVSSLLGEPINPAEYQNRFGDVNAVNGMTSKTGITVTHLPKGATQTRGGHDISPYREQIMSALRERKPVVMSGFYPSGSPSDWTQFSSTKKEGHHVVVATGLDSNGNIVINDPIATVEGNVAYKQYKTASQAWPFERLQKMDWVNILEKDGHGIPGSLNANLESAGMYGVDGQPIGADGTTAGGTNGGLSGAADFFGALATAVGNAAQDALSAAFSGKSFSEARAARIASQSTPTATTADGTTSGDTSTGLGSGYDTFGSRILGGTGNYQKKVDEYLKTKIPGYKPDSSPDQSSAPDEKASNPSITHANVANGQKGTQDNKAIKPQPIKLGGSYEDEIANAVSDSIGTSTESYGDRFDTMIDLLDQIAKNTAGGLGGKIKSESNVSTSESGKNTIASKSGQKTASQKHSENIAKAKAKLNSYASGQKADRSSSLRTVWAQLNDYS